MTVLGICHSSFPHAHVFFVGLHPGAADDESESSLPGDRVRKLNSQPNARGSKSNPNR